MKKLYYAIIGLMMIIFFSCTDQTQEVYNELPELSNNIENVSAESEAQFPRGSDD